MDAIESVEKVETPTRALWMNERMDGCDLRHRFGR